MFINPSILSTSTKKYFSIILFNMDAKKFMKASFIWTLFLSFILNSLGFLTLSSFLNYSVLEALCLILFSTTARIVGDAFSVYYYKKQHMIYYKKFYFFPYKKKAFRSLNICSDLIHIPSLSN